MALNGGKLRFDYGIDIWSKTGLIDKEVAKGDKDLLDKIISLMDGSRKNSDEENFFSGLATREIEIFGDRLVEWNKWTMLDLTSIEDKVSVDGRQRLKKFIDRNRKKVDKVMEELIENPQEYENFAQLIFSGNKNWDDQSLVQRRAELMISGFGLNKKMGQDLVRSWLTFDYEEMCKKYGKESTQEIFGNLLVKNLSCLHKVWKEVGEEGVKKLYMEYGVTNFGRYPSKMLVEQVRDEDDKGPYGVWLGPYADWNGGFISKYDIDEIVKMKREARALGYGLRVVEARDKMSTVRRMVQLDRKFGDKNKIAFMIVGGHGEANRVALGINKEDELTSEDLKREKAGEMKKLYQENMPFLFRSCSTGLGIGKEYSEFSGGYTMSPNGPSNISWVHLGKNASGDLYFEGEYNNGGPDLTTMIHKGGKEAKNILEEEKRKKSELNYKKMISDKKAMEYIWSGKPGSEMLLSQIIERERLEPLEQQLRKDFGGEGEIFLESGLGGDEDDSRDGYDSYLSFDLKRETGQDLGTSLLEDIYRGCKYVWKEAKEGRRGTWSEVRVIKISESGEKKILARYPIEMEEFWPENIP